MTVRIIIKDNEDVKDDDIENNGDNGEDDRRGQ
jgi:hypothetical protein